MDRPRERGCCGHPRDQRRRHLRRGALAYCATLAPRRDLRSCRGGRPSIVHARDVHVRCSLARRLGEVRARSPATEWRGGSRGRLLLRRLGSIQRARRSICLLHRNRRRSSSPTRVQSTTAPSRCFTASPRAMSLSSCAPTWHEASRFPGRCASIRAPSPPWSIPACGLRSTRQLPSSRIACATPRL